MAIGDTFEIVAGCDKRFATCREKFANAGGIFAASRICPAMTPPMAMPATGRIFDGGPLVQ